MFLPDYPNLEYVASHRDDAKKTDGLLGTRSPTGERNVGSTVPLEPHVYARLSQSGLKKGYYVLKAIHRDDAQKTNGLLEMGSPTWLYYKKG